MKILVLESSGMVASVAVVTEEKLVGEYTTNFKKTHSQTLLPMMDTLLKMIGMPIREMDAIAVSGGPGSFTGLRIGSATAKGLGLALNIPIISVPTVDAIAYNLFGTDAVVCPLMDARRNQTYTGLYVFEDDQMKCISGQKAVMLSEIVDEINQLGRKVIFLGDGVPGFKAYIEEHIQVPHSYAPIHLSQQRAGALVHWHFNIIMKADMNQQRIISRIISAFRRQKGNWLPKKGRKRHDHKKNGAQGSVAGSDD